MSFHVTLIILSVLGGSPNTRPTVNSFFTRYQIPGVGPYFFQYDLIYVSTWVPNGGGPKNFFKNLNIDLPIPGLVASHVTPPPCYKVM